MDLAGPGFAQRVFCGTSAGTLRVTDINTPRSEIVYDGHNGRVSAMCISSASDERAAWA